MNDTSPHSYTPSPPSETPRAAVLLIGNEILSGRTQDVNLNFLARGLNEAGVRLTEARVVRDEPEAIIAAINALRTAYDYVFTTGGIGPTHDDITTACIADAFGVKVVRDLQAEALLSRHYGAENLNAARLKMADIPEGATLIPNPVSAAPGFHIGNVFVMAGVPRIMQAMFGHIKPTLRGGPPVHARTLTISLTEGVIAADLTALQNLHPDVEMGSYPFVKNGVLGTSLVLRHASPERLRVTGDALRDIITKLGGAVQDDKTDA